jgi:hypothetical protein
MSGSDVLHRVSVESVRNLVTFGFLVGVIYLLSSIGLVVTVGFWLLLTVTILSSGHFLLAVLGPAIVAPFATRRDASAALEVRWLWLATGVRSLELLALWAMVLLVRSW